MRFPYPYRRGQERIVAAVVEAVARGGHAVLESGTGTGKTVAAVYAALREAEERDLAVLYLTRTNAQQRQVITEVRRIGAYGLGLQGRNHLCALLRTDPEFAHGNWEELSRACRERKSRELRGEEGCQYYAGLLTADLEKEAEWCRNEVPVPEDFQRIMEHRGICPYEMNKLRIPEAQVVAAPYVYLFHPAVRNALFSWMNRAREDLIVIVDEAHNLPEYARGLGSSRFSRWVLEQCFREIDEVGDPEILEGVTVRDFLDLMQQTLKSFVREYVRDEDGYLPPFALEEAILEAYDTTTAKVRLLAENLIVHGEVIREMRRRQGKLPRSHLHSLGSFVIQWLQAEADEFAKLVLGGDNPALEAYCLDAERITAVLRRCHASVHMSGTLRPLEEYRDTIGLPADTTLLALPSPFPPENRRVVYTEEVTTKYESLAADARLLPRLRELVVATCNATDRNTAVFFPSHAQLASFLDLRPRIHREVFVESPDLGQEELMGTLARFKGSRGVLFAVAGGRVSEGMDFPDRELEVAVIVGVPYPKPTARLRALEHFYDVKFGDGWRFAVDAPTQRKMLQCLGRLIRSETDRGVAVILDARARRYARALGDLGASESPAAVIQSFFEGEPVTAPRSLAASA
ncbi:MAG TPA: ATP-dependent DNA helicase [Thermoplasmata archaeon]|nr:ATP-dependent DNA helicase [Thermoplasmata archaeon]